MLRFCGAVAATATVGTWAWQDDTISLVQAVNQKAKVQDEPNKSPVQGDAYWPSGRGALQGHYGWSTHLSAPFDLQLSWKWEHPAGRYHTLPYGTAIDGAGNIILTAHDGIRKFSPEGKTLWSHIRLPFGVPNVATLWQDKVLGMDDHANVFALNAETGKVVWEVPFEKEVAQDNGFLGVHDGVMVVPMDSEKYMMNKEVCGVNATNGKLLWSFKPDIATWNFLGSFPGDGTMLFQDLSGKAYRISIKDGSLIWKAGGVEGSWTDGSAILGPRANVLYTVGASSPLKQHMKMNASKREGIVTARWVSNGTKLWSVVTPRPPNNVPAVGWVAGHDGLSLVVPTGVGSWAGVPLDVLALDPKTGEKRWVYEGPAQSTRYQAGDEEGRETRVQAKVRPFCMSNPWSAPTIDAQGTVFIGSQAGYFFALRDVDGDGKVDGPFEVSAYKTNATFAGSSGPSLAPGRVVVASCDTLYVFGNGSSVVDGAYMPTTD